MTPSLSNSLRRCERAALLSAPYVAAPLVSAATTTPISTAARLRTPPRAIAAFATSTYDLAEVPPRLRQRRLRTAIPTVSSWASARREAKSPSAEATKAAPLSFIALPREITPVSRPLAKSSKARTSRSSLSPNRTPFLYSIRCTENDKPWR